MASTSGFSYYRYLVAVGMAPLVIIGAIVLYAAYSIAQYARLGAFKGPSSAAFSRLWLLNCVLCGCLFFFFFFVCLKYGMCVGPGCAIVFRAGECITSSTMSVRNTVCVSDLAACCLKTSDNNRQTV